MLEEILAEHFVVGLTHDAVFVRNTAVGTRHWRRKYFQSLTLEKYLGCIIKPQQENGSLV